MRTESSQNVVEIHVSNKVSCYMAAALLEARGFVCVSELHRDATVAVFRAKKKATQEEVILKTRVSHPAERNIEHAHELLRRLHSSGATVEPISWFNTDGIDVLVMRECCAGFSPGFQCIVKGEGLELGRFFDLARTQHSHHHEHLHQPSCSCSRARPDPQPTRGAWRREACKLFVFVRHAGGPLLRL